MVILHLRINFGASPQLECWNTGKMEYWVRKFNNIPMSRIVQIFNAMPHKDSIFQSSLRSRSYFGGVGHSIIPLFCSVEMWDKLKLHNGQQI
jgi:hypothetical protein